MLAVHPGDAESCLDGCVIKATLLPCSLLGSQGPARCLANMGAAEAAEEKNMDGDDRNGS